MSKATYINVDPYHCITLTPVRRKFLSGHVLLVVSFNGKMHLNAAMDTDDAPAMKCVISSSTGTVIIVKRTGLFLQFLFGHLKRERVNIESFDTKMNSLSTWSGSVDNQNSQKDLVKLMDKYERLKCSMWLLNIAPGGHPVECHRQLSLGQNAKHDSQFMFE